MNILEHMPEPFPYQEGSISFACHKDGNGFQNFGGVNVYSYAKGRALFEIDPGLGKSRIGLGIAQRLCPNDQILVLCSKKALNTWRREWPKWTNIDSQQVVIVEGAPAKRAKLWQRDAQIFVVTYQSGQNDFQFIQKHDFKMVLADECKIWRNYKTKSFKFWKTYLHKVPYVIMLDGTIVTRGPQDLWTYLHIINRKLFSSYWRFVNTFCVVHEGTFGKEIMGAKNIPGLHSQLRGTTIRLKDNDPRVAGQRPPLVRDFKLVEMTKEQRELYDNLVESLMGMTPGGKILMSASSMALIVKLRQLLICPKILDETMGYGAAIEDLKMQLEDDPHSVIFTPFTKALPYMSQAVKDATGKEPFILKGGTDSKVVGQVEEKFNDKFHQDYPLICSIGFAESFELWSAKRCFFIGYDWAQDKNYQAEKRLHRLITPHPVNSWYYRHMGSIDDHLLETLGIKQHNVKLTFQDFISALDKGDGAVA